jgi:hypothetical protein
MKKRAATQGAAKKTGKRLPARTGSPSRRGASAPQLPPAPDDDSTRERFARDLEVRGEVAAVKDGKLPLHATHVKTGKPGGAVTVKRARFKAF